MKNMNQLLKSLKHNFELEVSVSKSCVTMIVYHYPVGNYRHVILTITYRDEKVTIGKVENYLDVYGVREDAETICKNAIENFQSDNIVYLDITQNKQKRA